MFSPHNCHPVICAGPPRCRRKSYGPNASWRSERQPIHGRRAQSRWRVGLVTSYRKHAPCRAQHALSAQSVASLVISVEVTVTQSIVTLVGRMCPHGGPEADRIGLTGLPHQHGLANHAVPDSRWQRGSQPQVYRSAESSILQRRSGAAYHGSWNHPDNKFADAVATSAANGDAPNFDMPDNTDVGSGELVPEALVAGQHASASSPRAPDDQAARLVECIVSDEVEAVRPCFNQRQLEQSGCRSAARVEQVECASEDRSESRDDGLVRAQIA